MASFAKGPPCDCEPLTSKDDWRHQTIRANTIQGRAASHSCSCWLEGASKWWTFWVVQGPFLLNYHSIEIFWLSVITDSRCCRVEWSSRVKLGCWTPGQRIREDTRRTSPAALSAGRAGRCWSRVAKTLVAW